MIMMRYDVILNQSECANLYDHRKNYTKKNVLKTHNILDKTVVSFGSSIWELLISWPFHSLKIAIYFSAAFYIFIYVVIKPL